jgi:hypothetical protein
MVKAKKSTENARASSGDAYRGYSGRKRDDYSLALDDQLRGAGAKEYEGPNARAKYFQQVASDFGQYDQGHDADAYRARMHRGKAYIVKAIKDNELAAKGGNPNGYDINSSYEAYRQSTAFKGKEAESLKNSWINAVRKNPRVGQYAAYALAENGQIDDAVKVFRDAFNFANRGNNYRVADGTLNGQLLSDYHVGLARVYERAGRFGSAKEHLMKALEALGDDSSKQYYQSHQAGQNKGYTGGASGIAEAIWNDKSPSHGTSVNTELNKALRDNPSNDYDARRSEGLNAYFAADKKIQGKKSSKKFAALAIVGLGGATFALIGSQMTGNVVGASNSLPSLLGTGASILGFLGILGLGFYIKNREK